jgi:DNA-binding NtrC family response regulator
MIDAISRARAFAPAATPVILHGESGTGKTFFAQFIHDVSQRSGGFHAFSVGTVPPQLAADELFGHVEGAYTDARRVRAGRITSAGSGTLLLDDLHTLELGVQKQLLQALGSRRYSPVGSDRIVTMGCRIILAMTGEPDDLMQRGLLLPDLRWRFGASAIGILSLRERREEIPLHARRALERCPDETNVEGPARFSDAALALLCEGEYPGNVRQLEGIVQCGYLIARHQGTDVIDTKHLPAELTSHLRYKRHGNPDENRVVVERALRITGGNVTAAAKLLGISRNTMIAFRAAQDMRREERRK